MKGILRVTILNFQITQLTNTEGLMACKTTGQKTREFLVILITLLGARSCIQACSLSTKT